jgi:hypothetical protein
MRGEIILTSKIRVGLFLDSKITDFGVGGGENRLRTGDSGILTSKIPLSLRQNQGRKGHFGRILEVKIASRPQFGTCVPDMYHPYVVGGYGVRCCFTRETSVSRMSTGLLWMNDYCMSDIGWTAWEPFLTSKIPGGSL